MVDQVGRYRLAGLPALALLPGAWLVHTDHIFSPAGVVGMLLIGVATGLSARNVVTTRGPSDATSSRATAS